MSQPNNSARKDEIAKLVAEMRQEAVEWRGVDPMNRRVARRLDHYADQITALTAYSEERTQSSYVIRGVDGSPDVVCRDVAAVIEEAERLGRVCQEHWAQIEALRTPSGEDSSPSRGLLAHAFDAGVFAATGMTDHGLATRRAEFLNRLKLTQHPSEREAEALRARVSELEAELGALQEGPGGEGWQQIETAPKDGSAVLLLSAAHDVEVLGETMHHAPKAAIGYWWPDGTSWVDEYGRLDGKAYTLAVTGVWASGRGWFQPNEVTHWMPLPPAPGQNAKDATPPASSGEGK